MCCNLQENELQIGNDIANIDVIRWILRTQFDRNIITLYDVQVNSLAQSDLTDISAVCVVAVLLLRVGKRGEKICSVTDPLKIIFF